MEKTGAMSVIDEPCPAPWSPPPIAMDSSNLIRAAR